ncbi:unnamed protein product [Protopolystoma xenopodis]|uniref:NADP-dependent oxidoreductase domain-containing protein n=1 Tax=Protopolystoma xenopodis TaxID=117903 RepID=A0A3S5ACZ5_9PLAT|nr:unnamed protein product [Protopolystoma xenopodis]
MEKLVDAGFVKSIGISNYNKRQTERILSCCRIKPVMNQIEIHVHFTNEKLVKFLKSVDIGITAYAPFGSPASSFAQGRSGPLDEPWVKEIAERHHKTTGQVLIRHCIQRGIVCIPKSVTPSRIRENFQVIYYILKRLVTN